jgi:hypothetical protein
MVTVNLGRSEDEFWRMTPRKTQKLIDQWAKMEGERMETIAKLTGYATVMYQNGKTPFEEKARKRKGGDKVVVDNDNAFLGL